MAVGSSSELGAPRRTMHIELLALDLTSCGRCTRTEKNLDEGLATAAAVLREADVAVRVEKHVVKSAAEAERLRMVSSPTIRIDGEDIALELRESSCKDCGDLCGCGGGVDCRVWVWRGKEYLDAPKPLIVDAVLRAYARQGERRSSESAAYRMPENLRTFFFAGVKKAEAQGSANGSCCDPSVKSKCCGTESKPSKDGK